jgi:hypothetical protein
MVNRVREVVLDKAGQPSAKSVSADDPNKESPSTQEELSLSQHFVRQKFLSWNAAAAGQTEVIEYLEELIELTKLLVGANEFRSGMLTRPTYREYVDRINSKAHNHNDKADHESEESAFHRTEIEMEQDELRDTVPEPRRLGLRKKISPKQTGDQFGRVLSATKSNNSREAERQKEAEEAELPRSLQRVRSRRIEERTERLGKVSSRQRGEEMWTK